MREPLFVDRPFFRTESVQVGVFRCHPDHPSFGDSGPTNTFCFVFPRTSVLIALRDGHPFVADPNVITLYNRDQAYRRAAISPDGDRSDWYAVSEDVLRDAIRRHDRRAAESNDRPIRFARAAADAATYREQRQLFVAIRDARAIDELFVEERVLGLLERVLASAYGDRTGTATPNKRAQDLVAAAQEVLGRRFAEPLRLADFAREINCSVYHLCRSFQRALGVTLHAYRDELRLRNALERLEEAADLTALALDLGYSSHSHFTSRFHRLFGESPSSTRVAFRFGGWQAHFRRTYSPS